MYAVVKIGGSQYRVTEGDTLSVGKINGAVGTSINFPALLAVDDGVVKLAKDASKVEVMAKILEHKKGDKVSTRHFHAKSRYRRHVGFRPKLTTIKIESIGKIEKLQTAPRSESPKRAKKAS